MQSTVYFFSLPLSFLDVLFKESVVCRSAAAVAETSLSPVKTAVAKAVFIITLCGRASGLTHLLDEVIKTNMMD